MRENRNSRQLSGVLKRPVRGRERGCSVWPVLLNTCVRVPSSLHHFSSQSPLITEVFHNYVHLHPLVCIGINVVWKYGIHVLPKFYQHEMPCVLVSSIRLINRLQFSFHHLRNVCHGNPTTSSGGLVPFSKDQWLPVLLKGTSGICTAFNASSVLRFHTLHAISRHWL